MRLAKVRCPNWPSIAISGMTGIISRQEVKNLQVVEKLARPERFELPTTWFVARYSIQLSYGR